MFGINNNMNFPILVLIPTSLRLIPVFLSHLHIGLPKGLFPVVLPVKILKALLPYFILRYTTCRT